ncbi:ABC transporter ATP-binding protein [Kitasatospora sp. YST-16]|uniref:ABC transporter ATP-binding protein n=1 Tax=Kitasatospora sp. YST-16 TaxID=2998080 RepID=UPI002283A2A4|nr:ABC transporter ATP-binding protein [Kitasatospora sp. YST-16]WAL73452.1 ABC transporter ATP-binding protein [Kitasatospora sp. YST-16]WNW39503.1 ABC transporter ATP-binding protein [Streptomyces sp. Li-HN-5-13]
MDPSESALGGVETSDLHYGIANRTLLKSVDLSVGAGRSVAITGPSGCGKSTLLGLLAGLLKPTRGTVRIAGEDITSLAPGRRAALRLRSIGMIYQFGELLPELSPLENTALPALLAGVAREEAYARGTDLLEGLGVKNVLGTDTGALSGGERQRVAVARALIGQPQVVLADEPTGALDGKASTAVADLLFSLPARYGCALVVVTHNPQVAARADQVLTMADGRLAPADSAGVPR